MLQEKCALFVPKASCNFVINRLELPVINERVSAKFCSCFSHLRRLLILEVDILVGMLTFLEYDEMK